MKRSLPKLIVVGSGTHAIKNFNGSMVGFEEFKTNLTLLSSVSQNII